MRTLTFRGLFAFAVALVIATPAMAQNLVRGAVFDTQQKPVEGATVHFEGTTFVFKRDAKTDKKGEFLFQGLQSGEYKITASKDGIGTHTLTYTVSSNSAKEKLTFDLRPASPDGAKPGAAAAAVAANPTVEALGAGAAKGAAGKAEATALQQLATAGLEAQKAGRHDEAIAKFNELVGKVSGCADCYVSMGNSYIELKKYDDAETAFKKSVEVKPSVEAYTQLARIYNMQKKFDQAGEASKQASDLAGAGGAAAGPGAAAGGAPTSETLYNQGVILWNAGKYAEAKTQFEAAVQANPGNADAQYQLGMANLNLGQLPAARTAFEGYLKAAPDGPKAAEVKTFLTQLPK